MSQTEVTILKPFDAHVHLRTGRMLRNVLPYTSCIFPRAVVMGNLENDPVDNVMRLVAYRNEILGVDRSFAPIMSVMLTRATSWPVLDAAYRAGARVLKFIPGTASTGGAQGLDLPDLEFLTHLLKIARDLGMVFSCHFELAIMPYGQSIPKEQQEIKAIKYLDYLVRELPGLKIVVEHVSSAEMIAFVHMAPDNVAATLTAHHAILTYKEVCDSKGIIVNGLNYCKPIAKAEQDRWAVRKAMTSGDSRFFFGSDSAPHPLDRKQGNNPAAGIFTGPVALPLLCQIFEEEGALSRLEDFVSVFGPKYYGLPLVEGTVTVKKESWDVPYDLEGTPIFLGGQEIKWKVC